MALSDGVFRDYSSTTKILDATNNYDKSCPSENRVLEVIHFKESMLETPVFRQFNELDIKKSSGKARGADAFGKAFVELGHRSAAGMSAMLQFGHAGDGRSWKQGMTIG